MERSKIAQQLPAIFRRTLSTQQDVLGALLGVMEALHAPDEKILSSLDIYFDPDRAEDAFIPYLSGWVDLDRFLDDGGIFPAGNPRLRDLILRSAELSRMRGTREGLIRFLEVATGVKGFNIYDFPDRPFHIRVVCPQTGDHFESQKEYRDLVRAIILAEKPAYVSFDLIEAPMSLIR